MTVYNLVLSVFHPHMAAGRGRCNHQEGVTLHADQRFGGLEAPGNPLLERFCLKRLQVDS